MKRLRLTSAIAVLLLILSLLFTGCMKTAGTSSSPRLDDGADLLTPEEEENVRKSLDYYSELYETDFVIVTVTSTGHKSDVEYADDYYDYHDFYTSGALLLITTDIDSRYISTTGSCEVSIDSSLDLFSEQVSPLIIAGDYETAFLRYASLCGECVRSQKNTGIGIGVVFVLAIGLISAVVATSSMKGKLKTVRMKAAASDYTVKDSLNLTKKQDLFLYRTVTRAAKPKSSSSSGGHYSSSGSHHGGGHI